MYSQHNESKFTCLFASRTSIWTRRSNCSLVSRHGSLGGADRFKRYLKSAQAVSWRRKSARSLGWLLPSAPATYNRNPFVSTDGKLERRLRGGEMGVREWEWPMVMAEADQMHRKHDLKNVGHLLENHCRGDLSNCPRRLLCGTQGCPCHDVEESTRGGGWDFGHHNDDRGTSGTRSGWCWVGFW